MKIKAVFLDLVSFGSAQAKVFNLGVILLMLAAVPSAILEGGPSFCIFKRIILPLIFRGRCPTEGFFAGCECPACGLTRAMSRLMHGDLAGAWGYNKLVFLVFGVMVVLIVVNLVRVVREYKKTGKIYNLEKN